MENNQTPTISSVPVQTTSPLQNPQTDLKTPEGAVLSQTIQTDAPVLPTETKNAWKKYLRLNYLLGILETINGISAFFGRIQLTTLVGAVFSFIIAFALFKKPKLGYILFGISALIFFLVYIAYRYTSTY